MNQTSVRLCSETGLFPRRVGGNRKNGVAYAMCRAKIGTAFFRENYIATHHEYKYIRHLDYITLKRFNEGTAWFTACLAKTQTNHANIIHLFEVTFPFFKLNT